MDSVVVFGAGVVVGVVLILALQAVRRLSPVPSPTADHPAGRGTDPVGSLIARAGGRSGGRAAFHTKVTVTGSRSLIRMDGGAPSVEIDGVAYHRLADVPADARELLVDELRLIRDTPNLPAGALSGLDAFMADDGATDPQGR
jgi:hypothetical protein